MSQRNHLVRLWRSSTSLAFVRVVSCDARGSSGCVAKKRMRSTRITSKLHEINVPQLDGRFAVFGAPAANLRRRNNCRRWFLEGPPLQDGRAMTRSGCRRGEGRPRRAAPTDLCFPNLLGLTVRASPSTLRRGVEAFEFRMSVEKFQVGILAGPILISETCLPGFLERGHSVLDIVHRTEGTSAVV